MQGIAHLRAQGVACPQSGGLHAGHLAQFQGTVPQGLHHGRRNHRLKAVLTRVSRPGHPHRMPLERPATELVLPQVRHPADRRAGRGRTREQGFHELDHPRPLQRDRARRCGNILDTHRRPRPHGAASQHPRDVHLDPGGIDDQQELLRTRPVDVEVIDDTPGLHAHQRVLALPRRQLPNVVRQRRIQEGFRPHPADPHLAHVTDVEDPGGLPHAQMLVHDRRVLHRHVPPAELHQSRSQPLMSHVQGRPLQIHVRFHRARPP